MIHSSELSNLQNIIQFIKPTNIFSYEDKSNITEMIADLISIYIKEDPLFSI